MEDGREKESYKVKVLFPRLQGSVSANSNESNQIEPTITPTTKLTVKPLFAPVLPTTPIAGPSIPTLPGMFQRHRIEVTPEQLLTCSLPTYRASGEVITGAIEILGSTNLDDETGNPFTNYGVPEQERFAALSQQVLTLSMNKDIVNFQLLINELVELIRGYGPNSNLTHTPTYLSGLKHLKHMLSGKEPMHTTVSLSLSLSDTLTEIGKKSEWLRSYTSIMRNVAQSATELVNTAKVLDTSVESCLVAGNYISKYPLLVRNPGKLTEWVCTLNKRMESLTLTSIAIGQSIEQLKQFQAHLNHLTTDLLNQALFNLIPLWCGNCAASLSKHEEANGKLQELKNQILKALQS